MDATGQVSATRCWQLWAAGEQGCRGEAYWRQAAAAAALTTAPAGAAWHSRLARRSATFSYPRRFIHKALPLVARSAGRRYCADCPAIATARSGDVSSTLSGGTEKRGHAESQANCNDAPKDCYQPNSPLGAVTRTNVAEWRAKRRTNAPTRMPQPPVCCYCCCCAPPPPQRAGRHPLPLTPSPTSPPYCKSITESVQHMWRP